MKASQGVTTVDHRQLRRQPRAVDPRRAPPPPLDLIGDRTEYRYPRFADYLAALDRSPPALNAACLVGHSTLRVGSDARSRPAGRDRPRSRRWRERLQEALDAGAIGLSSGLYYAPAAAAPPAEIEALAALLHPAGGDLHDAYARRGRPRPRQPRGELRGRPRRPGAGRDLAPQGDRASPISAAPPRPCRRSPRRWRARRSASTPIPTSPPRRYCGPTASKGRQGAGHLVEAPAGDGRARTGRDRRRMGRRQREAAERLQPAGAIYWMMDEADVQRVLSFRTR